MATVSTTTRPQRWQDKLKPGALLRTLLARRGSMQSHLGPEWHGNLRTIHETRTLTPILLTDAAALQIMIAVRAACRLGGSMAEAGVFMGGSARLICEVKGHLPLHLFDVFETQQHASDASGVEIRAHFGTVHGSLATVKRVLAPYTEVHFHPGIFPDSAQGLEDEKFSFVHLDMDLVSSTDAALNFFLPRMLAGAILIGDDYYDPGVRQCFADHCGHGGWTLMELPWGQVMVIKHGGQQ
jgi:O-methyltransferase